MPATDLRRLSPEARHGLRLEVVALRLAGHGYQQIAVLTGLSRTGVFDICKRHREQGAQALLDPRLGRLAGEGRRLDPEQELLLRHLIMAATPDELQMVEALWDRGSALRLVERHTRICLPPRTLAGYLERWGFAPAQVTLRSAAQHRWIAGTYPGIVARARVQHGELLWARQTALRVAVLPARPPEGWAGRAGRAGEGRPGGPVLLTSVNGRGQRRWGAFGGVLAADALLDFLARLLRGAREKLFVVMDGLQVAGDDSVLSWLAEHEDTIEVNHLPGPDTAGGPPGEPAGGAPPGQPRAA